MVTVEPVRSENPRGAAHVALRAVGMNLLAAILVFGSGEFVIRLMRSGGVAPAPERQADVSPGARFRWFSIHPGPDGQR